MSEDSVAASLLDLTAEIVTAHVANNSVHAADLPKMIATVHAALAGLGGPAADEPEHKPAVGVRKSLASDEHLISMIDGKRYKTLRRHIRTHGLTDKEYRARYNLPADYPMVAKAYSAARAAMAQAIGLGRKKAAVAVVAVEQAAPLMARKAGRGAKKAVAKAEAAAKPAAKRARKAVSEAVASAKEHLG